MKAVLPFKAIVIRSTPDKAVSFFVPIPAHAFATLVKRVAKPGTVRKGPCELNGELWSILMRANSGVG